MEEDWSKQVSYWRTLWLTHSPQPIWFEAYYERPPELSFRMKFVTSGTLDGMESYNLRFEPVEVEA